MILNGETVGGLTVYCKLQVGIVHLQCLIQTQWVILNGQTVGGLTVYCKLQVDIVHLQRLIQNTMGDIEW